MSQNPADKSSGANRGKSPNKGTDKNLTERQKSGRNAMKVGGGIFVSRLFGLLRESLLGTYLGTRTNGDAFGTALRIPKLLQNLLGEGSLSASFIPVYSQLLEKGDEKKAGRLAGGVLGLLLLFAGGLSLLMVLVARPLTYVLAPGFSGAKLDITVTLVRIAAPGMAFIVLAGWCLGVLNSHRKFFLSYVAPAIWSAAIAAAVAIAAIMNFSETSIAKSAAWGVMIGGALQFLIQIPAVVKLRAHIRLNFSTRLEATRTVFSRFGPAVAGRGVVTISSYLDLVLASLLATGAVAIMDRAQALYLMPISVFAISVAASDLPEISRESGSSKQVMDRIMVGSERVVFYLMFVCVMFIAAGHAIVGAIYERVNFTADDTTVVWLVLAVYSFGMLASGFSRILQNSAFGLGDVKGPAQIALVRMLFTVGIGIVLMFQFDRIGVLNGTFYKLGDLPSFWRTDEFTSGGVEYRNLGAVGLAAGAMLAAWIELSLTRNLVSKHLGKKISFAPLLKPLLPVAIVVAAIGGLLTWALGPWPSLIAAPLIVLVCGITYVLVANKRGSLAANELLRPVRRKLWQNQLND